MANQKTRLFTINLRQAQQGEGPLPAEWRGRHKPLAGSATFCFDQVNELIQLLERVLSDREDHPEERSATMHVQRLEGTKVITLVV